MRIAILLFTLLASGVFLGVVFGSLKSFFSLGRKTAA